MEYGVRRNSGRYDWESSELDEIEGLEKTNGVPVFSDLEVKLWNEMVRQLKKEDDEIDEMLRMMKENGDDF